MKCYELQSTAGLEALKLAERATPSSLKRACLPALAVPMTSAPRHLQIWSAACPTPPAAAWTRTF